VNSQALPQKN